MKNFSIFFLIIFSTLSLFGCQKFNSSTSEINNKSYINNFELLHENSKNQTRVKITSPKAIINQLNNNIEIFTSFIDILNTGGKDLRVKSGKSELNNFSNIIKVYNNVNISFLDNDEYYFSTNSFDWDLNKAVIEIKNPLTINLNDTQIIATNGIYNIDSNLLKIDNSKFYRTISDSEQDDVYQIEIKADIAKWYKLDNKLVFISNEKQVETTINFLTTK